MSEHGNKFFVKKEWRRESSAKRGYGRKWRTAREIFLKRHPLCIFHAKRGEVVPANVVDHILPHKGDQKLFWDIGNWQPLCRGCHDSEKRKQELGTYKEFGEDGWPIE